MGRQGPPRALLVKQELEWRLQAFENLTTFAQTMPIPGVPQTDNLEALIDAGLVEVKKGKMVGYDGRYDNKLHINKIHIEFDTHHLVILEKCQELVTCQLITPDGTICRNMMVFTPPGSAKSTLCTVVLPAWFMGRNPDTLVLATSYADAIAKKHGKRGRQLCMSPEYRAVFDHGLDDGTTAADNWAITNGSHFMAAGLQSGLTGNRAHLLIWDDPVRGRRAAESEAEQVSTWEAYRDDARTRKVPSAFEIGIQTRWHERDLAGRLLPEGWKGESGFIKCTDGKWWYVVCIQAQCETATDPLGRGQGEYFWKKWFQIDGSQEAYWAPFKLDARSWGSLYQQIPTPPEGVYFKQSWVQRYTHLSKDMKYYISADYAVAPVEDLTDPDWSAVGVWGVDEHRKIHFVDGWYGRTSPDEWIDRMLDLAHRYGALIHVAGRGQIRRATEPFIRERMAKRGIFVRCEWLEETYDKEVNARSFQAMMASGMVYWPNNHDMTEWVLRQLTGFGTIKTDDGVDMCSMLGRYLASIWEPKVPKGAEPPIVIRGGHMPIASLGAKKIDKL
jgi:predicted phage terminase large subunit-like protein